MSWLAILIHSSSYSMMCISGSNAAILVQKLDRLLVLPAVSAEVPKASVP
jgi:hypothetical protein